MAWTIDEKYVIGTFDEDDVTEQLDSCESFEKLSNTLMENDEMLADVVMYAVEYMRDWFYSSCGDVMWEALEHGVKKATGKSVKEWDEEE